MMCESVLQLICIVRSMPGLVSTGIKRKHHALDEGGGCDTRDCVTGYGSPPPSPEKCFSYTMQRKYVLNASICKLQATCNLIDPCLRRSVLIRNTLFHIEHELRAEGRHRDSFQLSTFIASTQSTCTDTADKDRLPGAVETANSVLPSPPRDSNSNHFKDNSTKGFCAYPENNGLLNRISIHSCANPSPSLLSPTSPGSMNTHSNVTNTANSGNHSAATTTTTTTSNSELPRLPNTNSEILDFGDELFSDIDMSLYDFDVASPFVSNHKASPVNSSEDWLRPVSGDFSSFSADVNSTASQGNSCRSDIGCDELDQIMHVLVDVGM
ncbi:uncharacterized protein [Asterias amurensis]|uniref:uncharacterized protein isoform X1 n=2 Tax=Asterias amurensis TaxID=7602 RepID=UPI003AB30B2F